MDFQSEDQREGVQMDFSWSGHAPADLKENPCSTQEIQQLLSG